MVFSKCRISFKLIASIVLLWANSSYSNPVGVLDSILKNATTPLIVGHRGMGTSVNGGISLYVENSVESFQKALEAGRDGVELDVFLTLDNQLLVIHGTYDGDMSMNVEGRSGPIESYTGSLSNLPLKLPENTAHKLQKAPTVPSLKEVLDAISPRMYNNNIFVCVELKGTRPELSREVFNLLSQYNITTFILSFNYIAKDATGKYTIFNPSVDNLIELIDNEQGIELGLIFKGLSGLIIKADFLISNLARYKAKFAALASHLEVLCPVTERAVKITSPDAKYFIDLLHSKGYYVGASISENRDNLEIIKDVHTNGLDILMVNEPAKTVEFKRTLDTINKMK